MTESGHQPGRAGDADRLAQDESDHDPQADGAGDRVDETVPAAHRNPGGEEGEDRNRDPGGERSDAVFEDLSQAVVLVIAGRRTHRDTEG